MKVKYLTVLFKLNLRSKCKKWVECIYKDHPLAFNAYGTLGNLFEKENDLEKATFYYKIDYKKNKLSTCFKKCYYICKFQLKIGPLKD